MDIEHDPEAWLIEQELAGRSQYDIAKELSEHFYKPDGTPDKMAQTTVGRNMGRIRRGESISGKMRRAIRSRFAYEVELDTRVEADQLMFLELMGRAGGVAGT